MGRAELELQAAAVLELKRRKKDKKTVFGIVCPEEGLIHSIQQKDGQWLEVDTNPDIFIAKVLEPVITSTKRFIVLLGGRGSSKSVGVSDICIADVRDNGSKTYCLREYQSSIKNSVHSLIKSEIDRHGFQGFDVLQQSIGYDGKEAFEFAGLARNIDSVKSTHGFRRFTVEEAQFISQASLDALTPTIREKPKNGLPAKFLDDEMLSDIETHPDLDKVSIIFIANPGSSADPFSQRFIEPYKKKLESDGIHEDELHLIIKVNYTDNPWFDDSGLETERAWDFENKSRAYYDHRWLGAYNDHVENALIKAEWFDACVDAHIKLGFKPRGQVVTTHDPSDGGDSQGLVVRKGSVVVDVQENDRDDVNDGCDWATEIGLQHGTDVYRWDCDGLGVSLKRQVGDNFKGKKVVLEQFKGSETPSRPNEVYQSGEGDKRYQGRTNDDIFKNKRAQCYWELRDRIYRTYRAVERNDREYMGTDGLISISSDIHLLEKLRSEVCRIPLKNQSAGLIQIMPKDEMKNKLKIESPNLADSLMMSMDYSAKINTDFLKPLKPKRGFIV